ncbi:response regulator receiver protein [Abditibacterium utsteinense]|uniref:Response regulator receiver protein n=1 Tax=Abditibacterium utsteinense TaxID=1960156 RepID=A0A2S8SQI2_9BACT|nr:response regulator [Abditibacterium utsteinense]PQV63057.1 response regulator receiver protein [Abditibacterium utsteinense]
MRRKMVILLADDDEDDRLLARDALRESGESADLRCVSDGKQLLDYLRAEGSFAAPDAAPRADLILLDLNMPCLDGREALRQIKGDKKLRRTPVVILTTSRSHVDVWGSYDEGANSFISKPVSFEELIEVMRNLRHYWADTVQLPRSNEL